MKKVVKKYWWDKNLKDPQWKGFEKSLAYKWNGNKALKDKKEKSLRIFKNIIFADWDERTI